MYLYQRRTGDYLSLRGGLQIGWMTGLFCFIVTMVMLTLLLAVFAGVGESGLQKITAESGRPEIAEVFSGMLTNPAMLRVCPGKRLFRHDSPRERRWRARVQGSR